MLYSRHEIVELVHTHAPEMQALIVSLMWHASHGDPNLVTVNATNERYGLLQVDLGQARAQGFAGNPNELLEPETNIRVGAQLLHKLGLLVFCGRELSPQIANIMTLERFLREHATNQPDVVSDIPNVAKG